MNAKYREYRELAVKKGLSGSCNTALKYLARQSNITVYVFSESLLVLQIDHHDTVDKGEGTQPLVALGNVVTTKMVTITFTFVCYIISAFLNN